MTAALSAEAFCLGCHRVLPDAAASGLARRLVDALGERPQGATTRELVLLVGRRFESVAAALSELEADGLVERFAESRGRAWNARPYRLAQKAPGATSGQRQRPEPPVSDLPPAIGELGVSAALTAALGARSLAAACAFLAAGGLFVVGLAVETRAIVPTRWTGGRP